MNNKRKIITCAILGAITLSACGTIGYVSSQNRNNEFISNQLNSNIIEKGISVKCAVIDDPTATYGAQVFNYFVKPNSSNDNIAYKILYVDGTSVDDSILKIIHDKENNSIQVNCNAVFKKQIILTLYLTNNEDVKAEVAIDFVEMISFHPQLKANEGEKLAVDYVFNSSGGSILLDRNVKNLKINWTDDFVETIEEYFILTLIQYDAVDYTYGSIIKDISESFFYDGMLNNGEYTGSLRYFNTKEYTTSSFLEELNLGFQSNNGSSYSYSIGEFSALEDLLDESVWRNNVFEYSCIWNNQTYSGTFGLILDESKIVYNLTSDVSNLRFGGEVGSTNTPNNDSNEIRQIFTELDTSKVSVSSSTPANNGSSSFVYTILDRFENKVIKKIGLPIKTISDYTQDNTYSIHVISQDITSETKYNTYTLTIEANKYSSNTINKWVYFDVNIPVNDGQTLAFGSSSNSIQIGCYSENPITEDCSVYNKIVNGVADDHKTISSKILLDIYY